MAGGPSDSVPDVSAAQAGIRVPDADATTERLPLQTKVKVSAGETPGPAKKASEQRCRFYATKHGCRAGQRCRFVHSKDLADSVKTHDSSLASNSLDTGTLGIESEIPVAKSSQASSHESRRPEPKPKSAAEAENPREYQIGQVVRRFSPFRADLEDLTTLKFKLQPTDPDFPFDLEYLQCCLKIPLGYPSSAKPSLEVQNSNIPKSFQINVDRGFDDLCRKNPQKSLLALLNDLDRNLERFLSAPGAMTFKIVANQKQVEQVESINDKPALSEVPHANHYERPQYTTQQLQSAAERRRLETSQLDARLGRSENYSKAGDGIAFTIPLRPASNLKVPNSLRNVQQTALIVPEVYPLEPCTVVLLGVSSREAENVEVNFEKHAVEKSQLSLMAHINFLTQNLDHLSVIDDLDSKSQTVDIQTTHRKPESMSGPAEEPDYDPERPHLRYMPRPPEWGAGLHSRQDSSDTSDATSDTESDADDDDDTGVEDMAGGAPLPFVTNNIQGKGTQLSFPGLSLVGIELLQISKLSVCVKCDRCKMSLDVSDIPVAANAEQTVARSEICEKCSAMLRVSYRSELMHNSSNRAAFVDAEGCSVIELLPSVFQPTCAECSTVSTVPETVAVSGDTKTLVCRTCHCKMTFHLPDVKVLRLAGSQASNSLPPRVRKAKEKAITPAGTPLPDYGKCQHYSKSYRWFRFSCCMRVFPCDKCHDSKAINPSQKENPHPNEHAERMVCGFCSREQRYHPEICRHCGHSVIKKSITSGYWEGGKGTREKHLMRRNERHKYKMSGTEKKELNKRRIEAKGKGGMWWPE